MIYIYPKNNICHYFINDEFVIRNNLYDKLCIYIDNIKYIRNLNYSFTKGNHIITLKFNKVIDDAFMMFYGCEKIINIDFSYFNTKIITNMGKMFYECKKLENIDLSMFNNEKILYMDFLFYDCINLKNINLSSVIYNNIYNIGYMFYTLFYIVMWFHILQCESHQISEPNSY